MSPIPRAAAVLLAVATAAPVVSQTPALVRDIRTTLPPGPSSNPSTFTAFAGRMFFTATTPGTGYELFVTDGTTAGTSLFYEFMPGPSGSRLAILGTFGGDLYVAAEDPTRGRELWATDGTPAGTRLVRDIAPGPASGMDVTGIVPFGGFAWFEATGPNGTELWRTDGTTAGTSEFVDLVPGPVGSEPTGLRVVGTRLVFATRRADAAGNHLFRTDGTIAGTAPLAPGVFGQAPWPVGELGGRLFLTASPGAPALVVTDGTTVGTSVIAGAPRVTSAGLAVAGRLVFGGEDAAHGAELWATDGTATGTRLVLDFVPGPDESRAWPFGAAGGQVLVSQPTPGTTAGIWRTDGTTAATTRLTTARFASAGAALGGSFVFSAETPAAGAEPWISDGTAAGTRRVADLEPGSTASRPLAWATFGSRAVFGAEVALDGEPWITDGTAAGTRRLADLATWPPGTSLGSFPSRAVDWFGHAVFLADRDGGPFGVQPYRSDGTAGGTVELHRFPQPSPFDQRATRDRLWVHDDQLTILTEGYPTATFWCDDGFGVLQGSTIAPADQVCIPQFGTAAGGFLWLSQCRLWRIDRGIAIDTGWFAEGQQVRLGAELLALGSSSGARTLFRCNGGGCTAITGVGNLAFGLTAAHDRAFYAAPGSGGQELWITDGTSAGTRELDLLPGPAGSSPNPIGAFGEGVLTIALDAAGTPQLFYADATTQPARQLSRLPNGVTRPAFPEFGIHRVGGDRAVFLLSDPTHGLEPWAFDGSGQVALLLDVVPGPRGSEIEFLATVGDEVVFADRATRTTWRTDGTPAGTTMVVDRAATWATLSGGRLFFDGEDRRGVEPWAFWPGATAKPIGTPCGSGTRATWLDVGDPVLGQSWTVAGGGGPTNSVGLLVLGLPAPVPVRLGSGCVDYLDPATISIAHTIADAARPWQFTATLPRDPSLLTRQLVLQQWTGPSPHPLGYELSGAVWLSLDD